MRNGDGAGRCAQRQYGDAMLEALHQFLKHKYGAGDGGVKGGGETGARAGGEQFPAIRQRASRFFANPA